MRNLVLLIFSLVFYAWDMPKYALLMMATILFGYLTGIAIGYYRRRGREKATRAVLIISVAVNLGILAFFKYTDFLIDSINGVFGGTIPLIGLALPIGISFYTFQTMSYTVDVWRGDCGVQKNIIDFAAYVTMFPQLIAGPIVRYETVEKQLSTRRENIAQFGMGCERFIIGLAKKVLLANSVGALYSELSSRQSPDALCAWLTAIAFTFQIFFDFSGYSDMAIGLGKMFGFEFLENFNLPYISKSITEFWRRWHISLGTWFREYVYIPLGGNRCKKPRMIFNIAVTWLLTGIWHGASWNFLLWGAYFAVLLIAEKLFLLRFLEKAPRVLQHIYALFFIVLGWAIFSNESAATIFGALGAMFRFGGVADGSVYALYSNALLLLICVFFSTSLPKKITHLIENHLPNCCTKALKITALCLLLVTAVCFMVGESYNPFLYFRF